MVCILSTNSTLSSLILAANKSITVHWEDVGEEDEEPLNQSSGRFEASAGQLISAGEESDFF